MGGDGENSSVQGHGLVHRGHKRLKDGKSAGADK